MQLQSDEDEILDLTPVQTRQIAGMEDNSSADEGYNETARRFLCIMPSCRSQYSPVSFVRFFLCESLVGSVFSSTEMSESLRILGHELILMANCQCLKCARNYPSTMNVLSSNTGRILQGIECPHAKRASSMCTSFSHMLSFLEDAIQNISHRRSFYLHGNINFKELCISLGNLLVTAHQIYSDSVDKHERGRVLEFKAYENRFKNVSVDGKELQQGKEETNYDGPDENDYERACTLYPGHIQCRPSVLFDAKIKTQENILVPRNISHQEQIRKAYSLFNAFAHTRRFLEFQR